MKIKAIILALVVTFITLFFFAGQVIRFGWRIMGWLKFWGKQKAKAIENVVSPEAEAGLSPELG